MFYLTPLSFLKQREPVERTERMGVGQEEQKPTVNDLVLVRL